jgi:hypothetical protein
MDIRSEYKFGIEQKIGITKSKLRKITRELEEEMYTLKHYETNQMKNIIPIQIEKVKELEQEKNKTEEELKIYVEELQIHNQKSKPLQYKSVEYIPSTPIRGGSMDSKQRTIPSDWFLPFYALKAHGGHVLPSFPKRILPENILQDEKTQLRSTLERIDEQIKVNENLLIKRKEEGSGDKELEGIVKNIERLLKNQKSIDKRMLNINFQGKRNISKHKPSRRSIRKSKQYKK